MTMFEQFREFVAGKPRNERYNFGNTKNCAIAQFGKHLYGEECTGAGGSYFRIGPGNAGTISVDNGRDEVDLACLDSTTFGQLYDKLALLEDHS